MKITVLATLFACLFIVVLADVNALAVENTLNGTAPDSQPQGILHIPDYGDDLLYLVQPCVIT